MKKAYVLSSGLVALALLAAVVAGCAATQAAPQAAPSAASQELSRYITVVGRGKVSLVPDVAEINVGAEASGSTVSEAKAEVDSRMEAIVVALKEMGVTDEEIQTSHYSIYYEREPFYPVPRGEGAQEAEGVYRVSNMLRVTIKEIEQVGEILDAVVEAGANQMYGVSFTISDDESWQSDAREKAMADARARAEDLASLAGVKLGEVLSVSEVIGSSPIVVEREMAQAYGGGGVAPGELEISLQIQVTFAIQ
jgi:uncharacterized protein YggE